MRRSCFAALLALLLTALAGCGNTAVENPASSAEPAGPATEPPAQAPTQALPEPTTEPEDGHPDVEKEDCVWSDDPEYPEYGEEWDPGVDPGFDLDYARMDLLFLYKDVQNGSGSVEELPTALSEQGWPDAAVKDEARYLLYNIDGTGPAELIVTYFGYIADVYGSDGYALRYAYGCPYRGMATLYADGMLEEAVGLAADTGVTTWYRFNTELGIYFPALQMTYRAEKDETEDAHYYRLAYETRSADAIQYYAQADEYPLWIWDHAEEITAEEFEGLCSHSDPVTLPEGSRLSEFEGLGNLRILIDRKSVV